MKTREKKRFITAKQTQAEALKFTVLVLNGCIEAVEKDIAEMTKELKKVKKVAKKATVAKNAKVVKKATKKTIAKKNSVVAKKEKPATSPVKKLKKELKKKGK